MSAKVCVAPYRIKKYSTRDRTGVFALSILNKYISMYIEFPDESVNISSLCRMCGERKEGVWFIKATT